MYKIRTFGRIKGNLVNQDYKQSRNFHVYTDINCQSEFLIANPPHYVNEWFIKKLLI